MNRRKTELFSSFRVGCTTWPPDEGNESRHYLNVTKIRQEKLKKWPVFIYPGGSKEASIPELSSGNVLAAV
jgi:hypothetical protein